MIANIPSSCPMVVDSKKESCPTAARTTDVGHGVMMIPEPRECLHPARWAMGRADETGLGLSSICPKSRKYGVQEAGRMRW